MLLNSLFTLNTLCNKIFSKWNQPEIESIQKFAQWVYVQKPRIIEEELGLHPKH